MSYVLQRCSRELQNSIWVQLHSEIMVSSQKAHCHRLGKRPLAPALDLCTSTLLTAFGSWRLDLEPSGGITDLHGPALFFSLLFSSPCWTLAPCTMYSAGISYTLLTWDVRRYWKDTPKPITMPGINKCLVQGTVPQCKRVKMKRRDHKAESWT